MKVWQFCVFQTCEKHGTHVHMTYL